MIRVLVSGAGGRMGGHVLDAIAADPALALGGALEASGHPRIGEELVPGVSVSDKPDTALDGVDVAIDFCLPAGTLALIDAALPRGVPLVIGTTGFDAAGEERISRAAQSLAIVREATVSLGIHVMLDLVADAVRRLPGYQIEVLELHHDRKLDAPSGTALHLAEAAAEARGVSLDDVAVYHREWQTGPHTPGAIGMQSLRLGDSVGEHTVYLGGPGERLEITHRALSRDNVAAGALRAAAWLPGRPAGLYSIRDVLAEEATPGT